MQFTEHRDSNILTVQNYQPGQVKINQFILHESFFCNQHDLSENWDCVDITTLNESHLTPLLALNPDVIILGSGEAQNFPSPSCFAYCASRGVGLEVMDNAAACRTYNVLTTEEREVVLALIMPSIQK